MSGVLYINCFKNSETYFNALTKAHEFQQLTESNKPGYSFRKGILLSEVTGGTEGIEFNLMRSPTNFVGPTEGFVDIDREIIQTVNNIANTHFSNIVPFNHVLAQVYHNSVVHGKQKKARIGKHSDKTTDIHEKGLIAFITFYDRPVTNPNAMCKLRFKSKKDSLDDFEILLEPGSVLIIDLEINRDYTHEISPSWLNVEDSPTRLGYVLRASKTKAVYRDHKVYIKDESGNLIPLRVPNDQDRKEIKEYYLQENKTNDKINYNLDYSLNEGDYLKPLC